MKSKVAFLDLHIRMERGREKIWMKEVSRGISFSKASVLLRKKRELDGNQSTSITAALIHWLVDNTKVERERQRWRSSEKQKSGSLVLNLYTHS